MKIMFMGTPEISAICLERLIKDGHNIVAAVTREDKPRGRGNVMTPTPVKLLSEQNGIPVYTPATLRDGEFMKLLDEYTPDLIAVVAYGKILPAEVINYPHLGCINLHVSLLPKHRGAAPMQRAIMEGDKETGVTVMYMDVGLDTGDIIESEKFPINPDDDFEAIHDRSATVGSRLLSEVIVKLGEGRAVRTPQDDTLATYAAKIEKEDCKIDFNLDARTLDCRIRGVTPIPGAFCYHGGKMLKILRATPIEMTGEVPGTVVDINPVGTGSFTVLCGTGALVVTSVKPEGKGAMSAGDFIRGRKIAEGDILN